MKFDTLSSRNMFYFDRPPMTGDFGWSARRELPLGPLSHSENSLLQDRTVKRRHDLRFLLVAKIANECFSRTVAESQRIDRPEWARIGMGAIHSEVINANVSSPCHAATCTTERPSHALSLFFRRRDAAGDPAACAAVVCIHDRSRKWHESRWFLPLCGSR